MFYKIGNKAVYCSGKIFLGGAYCQAIIAFFMLVVPAIVFLTKELPKYALSQYYTIGLYAFLGNTFFSLLFYFVVFLTDPGIVVPPLEDRKDSGLNVKMIEFKNKTYALKYCVTCRMHRPLRAHHCRICNVCIDDLDHHCPWVGNCIGRRNRLYFILFIFFTFLVGLETFLYSVHDFSTNSSTIGFTNAFHDDFLAFCLTLYSGILGLALLLLLVVQITLIFKGLTTVEYLKDYWRGLINPYNEGKFTNCMNFMKIDFRKQNVTMEYLITLKNESRNSLSTNKSIDVKLESTTDTSIEFQNLSTRRESA